MNEGSLLEHDMARQHPAGLRCEDLAGWGCRKLFRGL
jgi:hypothetical protein